MRLVQKEKVIPEWKKKEVEELAKLINEYPIIAVADISKTPTNILQKIKVMLKDKLKDDIVMKTTKNNLFRLAAEKAGLKGRDKLDPYLTGQKLFIFTRLNPFLLNSIIERTKIPAPAKPGMVVDREIVVEPMDTGLQPGPLLSAFGKLRIPTRVQGGTIWIAKRTKLAKPGDVISADLASMLQRLGIYPGETGINLQLALDDGILMLKEQLKLDIDEYRTQLITAHLNAIAVGAEAGAPIPEVLEHAISRAQMKAIALAAEAGYITPDTAEAVLSRAVMKAYAIVAALGDKAEELGLEKIQVATPQPAAAAPAEEKKEEEEEEEEEEEKKELSEEELASGLGALFG